jgi:demethylmenaquinone methyltransferase/2-methoxy-6-polyprenyl-1,4-benzoquinol methylase
MGDSEWEKKRGTIRHYDSSAASYDQLYSHEQNMKIEAALTATKIEEFDTVLDVGCGTGLLFEHVGGSAKLLVGIDASLGLLKVADERAKRLPLRAPVYLIRADADHLPLRKKVFDKAFAVTVLQNMPNPVLVLREMLRVTKKDSALIITGLKKTFTKERFIEVLGKSGLEPSLVKTNEEIRCHIAVCHKNR